MMKYLIICFFLISCSSLNFSKKEEQTGIVYLDGYKEMNRIDYKEHLESFEKVFLKNNKSKIIELPYRSRIYLTQLIDKIIFHNELFFKKLEKPQFYVIDDKVPFHFSLPGKKFFFSKGLIQKYIKNEVMLYCVLTYELIRSEKEIYPKNVIIPTKTLSANRILSLLRIKTHDKVEVHKWAFYILKRVGIDSETYLTWLQIKNRNSLDFAFQLGDVHSISREEAMFKAFMIKNLRGKSKNRYKGSSRKFYQFVKNLKGNV